MQRPGPARTQALSSLVMLHFLLNLGVSSHPTLVPVNTKSSQYETAVLSCSLQEFLPFLHVSNGPINPDAMSFGASI